MCQEKTRGSDSVVTVEHFSLPGLLYTEESVPAAQGPLISCHQVMDIAAAARLGQDASTEQLGCVTASPCGQGIPFPVLKTAVAKIFQVRHQQKKVFQDLGIRATDPEIPGLAKQREAGCPGAR